MNIEKLNEWLSSPGYDEKLTERLIIHKEASDNYFKRLEIMAKCANDPIYFIENFGWVFEPRNTNQPDIEFFLFDYQKDVIQSIRQAEVLGEDRLFEKSRDMGLTWVSVWYLLWRWLFTRGWIGLYGSRKQEEVDNKTLNSFFGKLRYGLYRLPKFMFPKGFVKKLYDTENKLINPELGSLIQGESSNPGFGRDRRSSICILDELFLLEYGQEMWRNVAETSKCRIGISTPKPTRFAKILREAMKQNGWLYSFNWRQHPFKDEKWYEKEKQKYLGDEMGLKMELELEYLSDPSIVVYPQAELIKIGNVPYDPSKPLYVSMDWGNAPSQTVLGWWQFHEKWVLLESIYATEKPFPWYVPFLKPDVSCEDFVYSTKEKEVLNKVRLWRQPNFYYGEAAHYARTVTTATSVAQELAKLGITLRYNPNAIGHEKRQAAVKTLLHNPGMVFNDTYYNRFVLDALTMARFPKTTTTKEKVAPIHDETADARAMVENFAVNQVISGGKVKSFVYNKRYANF